MQYQSKRSGFPQYENQWQYVYQIGTMEARVGLMQTDRREHLPQMREIAISQVHQPSIIDNLKNTPENFYGGKISNNFVNWRRLTSDKWIFS